MSGSILLEKLPRPPFLLIPKEEDEDRPILYIPSPKMEYDPPSNKSDAPFEIRTVDCTELQHRVAEFLARLPERFSTKEIPVFLAELYPICRALEDYAIRSVGDRIFHAGEEEKAPSIDEKARSIAFDLKEFFLLLLEESGEDVFDFRFSGRMKAVFLETLMRTPTLEEILESIYPEKSSLFPAGIKEAGFSGVVQFVPKTSLVSKASRIGKAQIASLRREVFILSQCQSEDTPCLEFFSDLENRPILYLERAGSKNLEEEFDEIDEISLFHVLNRVCRGLLALYETGHFHADIKPSNIVNGMIVDFGSATKQGKRPSFCTKANLPPEFFSDVLPEGEVAEVFDGYAMDVWQLGHLLLNYYTKKEFFESLGYTKGAVDFLQEYVFGIIQTEQKTNAAEKPKQIDFVIRLEKAIEIHRVPKEPAALIRNCLQIDPAARPTVCEVRAALEELLSV